MTVFCVIVTYSDRFHLLEQVIRSCINEGVDKIIVVDNNSEINSKKKLKQLELELGGSLRVLYLNKNLGSAGGYKRGLEEAYQDRDCDYIWLLDDDNKPDVGSLKVLKEYWKKCTIKNKKHNVCLLSFRKNRKLYKQAVILKEPDLVLGDINSFEGFHYKSIIKKSIRRLKKDIINNINSSPSNGIVSVAYYGGMFINKGILDIIGYPDEKYFLYADDNDWSYRITKNGGEIYLLLNSQITDIDPSWHTPGDTHSIFSSISTGDPSRVYNAIKNRVYFERKYLVRNNFIYAINILMFLIILFPFTIKNIVKYFTFIKGIRHGFKMDY